MTDFLSLPFKVDFALAQILLAITAIIMLITCFRLVKSKNLLESIIIMSVFSLSISLCYLFMDAPDVAMTETALGACLSTCVLLNVAKITGEDYSPPQKTKIIFASLLCLIFFLILCWAGLDFPEFGSADTPLQTNLTKYYIDNTRTEIGIPSMVAAILGSYRAYDTFGETIVVLIAGLAVLLVMSRRRKTNA
jgi:multicomponent Na+:H+ antiporter subunit B